MKSGKARRATGEGWAAALWALAIVIGCAGPAGAAPGAGAASAPAASPTQPSLPASVPPSWAARKQAVPVAPVKLVDINSASRVELRTLPGVDAALADKIVANRPYLSKAELVTKNVLPTGPYLALKERVVAMQKTGRPKGKG